MKLDAGEKVSIDDLTYGDYVCYALQRPMIDGQIQQFEMEKFLVATGQHPNPEYTEDYLDECIESWANRRLNDTQLEEIETHLKETGRWEG